MVFKTLCAMTVYIYPGTKTRDLQNRLYNDGLHLGKLRDNMVTIGSYGKRLWLLPENAENAECILLVVAIMTTIDRMHPAF